MSVRLFSACPPSSPNRPDRAPGGGVWGGGRISHADEPQRVGGFPPLWGPPGCLLGRLGGPFGPSRGLRGPSWGPLWGLLCRIRAMLGASWAVLGRRRAEKKQLPKSFKHLRNINDFGPFGPSWRTSWRALGPSWRPLGPSWGGLWGPGGRLGASEARKSDNVKNIEKKQ